MSKSDILPVGCSPHFIACRVNISELQIPDTILIPGYCLGGISVHVLPVPVWVSPEFFWFPPTSQKPTGICTGSGMLHCL